MPQLGGYGLASMEDSRIGEALKANLTEEALKSYGVSLKIKLQLIDTDPRNLSWWYDLGNTHAHMGEVLSLQGDFAGAVKKYKAAQEIFHSLVNADPKNPFWRIDFSATYHRLALREIDVAVVFPVGPISPLQHHAARSVAAWAPSADVLQ